jgi:hypothetical protein
MPGQDSDELTTAVPRLEMDEGLRQLTLAVIRLAAMTSEMAGAHRPEFSHIAADLMDVAKLIGLQHPDAPNPRPTSAWPEGEGKE